MSIPRTDPVQTSTFATAFGELEPLNEWHQVARYLHCGRTRVFALIKSGALESVKVGRKRLVPASSVIAHVEALRRDAHRPIAPASHEGDQPDLTEDPDK